MWMNGIFSLTLALVALVSETAARDDPSAHQNSPVDFMDTAKDSMHKNIDIDSKNPEFIKNVDKENFDPLAEYLARKEEKKANKTYKKSGGTGNEVPHDSEHGREPYGISFMDDVTDDQFKGVKKWLEARNIEITEEHDESFFRFLVGQMTREDVTELESVKEIYNIEDVELDDYIWQDGDEHSEL